MAAAGGLYTGWWEYRKGNALGGEVDILTGVLWLLLAGLPHCTKFLQMPCTLSTISNHTHGFDFEDVFNVYLYLNSTCPPESDIFSQGTQLLTNAACRVITRTSSSIWTGWTVYLISDIWNRIVTWKLPLFQLVAQFSRPPLGWKVETATMVHLLGDPIDSMASLILTLALCNSRASLAKKAGVDSFHKVIF